MLIDTQIFRDVTWKLNNDPRIDANNITVGVKDAVVTLTGHVKRFYEKGYVENAVKSVRGVLGIAEELEIDFLGFKPPSDADIAQAALKALGWDVMFSENKHNFQVVVEGGMVTLTGQVGYQFQKNRAFSNVRYLKGVKGVLNKITVKSWVKPSKVKEQLVDGFVKSARLDAEGITVEVDGSVVTLRGKVHSWFEHEEAKIIAGLIPGVTKVENFIRL